MDISAAAALIGVQAAGKAASLETTDNARLSGEATVFLEKHKKALTMHRIMLTFQSPGEAVLVSQIVWARVQDGARPARVLTFAAGHQQVPP